MIASIFYFLAFVSIFFAFMVVASKNPVHSVLYLILTFFTVAGHYLLLNAQFLALVHIVVYAGAIMVLFLFVIMLLNLNVDKEPVNTNLVKFAGAIAGGSLMLVLIAVLSKTSIMLPAHPANTQIGLIKNLGKVLYTEYNLPFEIASILFLVAMIGAVILAKKNPHTT